MLIKEVTAKAILDSRSEKAIEVSINNCKASSPSGKSTGKYETPPYYKSIENNIKLINNLKELKHLEINTFKDLKKVELLIKKKFKLKDVKQFGANALFSLESAILKALAKENKKELWQVINQKANKFPDLLGNAIGGGLHSKNKNHPEFQEFLIIPKGKSIKEKIMVMNNTYQIIGKELNSKSINDEGAWTTSRSNEEVLFLLSKYKKISIGIDIASSSFYCDNNYNYGNKQLDKNSQIYYINSLIKKYNILYIEDPLQEEDFQGFSKIIKKNLVVGDDLTATHKSRLLKAIKNKSINAIIIKPNQNGSLLELKEIIDLCKKNKIKTIFSHRSGETLDNAISDYAFAFQVDYVKFGIATKWREAKLKRLSEIEKW